MSDGLEVVHRALAGQRAWFVGGAVRDRLLGRPRTDLDVVVDGDAAEAARALARAGGRAACFALSEDFGAWRVAARDCAWQIDVERMRGDSLEADLRLRDFTVNAIAEPVDGGAPIDPLGGLEDLAGRRLRMAAAGAFVDDPLRVLRLVRIAVELDFEPERETADVARDAAPRLSSVAGERVFMELRRILDAPRARYGLELAGELGAMREVLPELDATRGIEQNRYHHRDVYGHTLEVLDRVIALQDDPRSLLGASAGNADTFADSIRALLAEPLADGLTRGGALRWGALLHDAAKPQTRAVRPEDGRVTFFDHDARGAELARSVLARLHTSERLRAHVAALVRHHLRLGFMVHEPQPLARASVFDYLRTCEPVEVDVTLLSVADRHATRGDRAAESIEAHLRVARAMVGDALRWREAGGAPKPLLRGDELARELDIATGPRIGELLEALVRAQYTADVRTRAQALDFARTQLEARMRS